MSKNSIASAYVQILPSMEGIGENISRELSGVGEQAGTDIGNKLGGALKMAGIAAIGAVVADFGKEVVSSFADYEQLTGGMDTLFKESSEKIKGYASEAFKTAGVSANEYMDTVTGFSASLISSLGGDTEKAAEMANRALIDMSDNANKMGTDIESIKNAYQGFAKGQYNMLDNLRLGYGGSQEEMQRLLADAEAISGVHYDISSYADVISAVGVIQEKLGIAGATAEEAESTISGSIAMLAASFENLKTGLADSDADVGKLVGDVANAFGSVAKNILPTIGNIASAIPELLSGVMEAAPELLEGLLEQVDTVAKGVINGLPKLVSSIVSFLTNSASTLLPAALEMMKGLVQAIPPVIQQLAAELPNIINTVVNFFTENIDLIITGAVELFMAIVDALPIIIQALTENMPQILESILHGLIVGIPKLIEGAVMLFGAIITAIPEIVKTLAVEIPKLVGSIVGFLVENSGRIDEAVTDILVDIMAGFIQLHEKIKGAMSEVWETIKTAVGNWWESMKESGRMIIEGLIEGLKEKFGAVQDTMEEFGEGFIEGWKSLLGIASPSKVFEEIGGYVGEGFENGISRSMSAAVDEAQYQSTALERAVSGRVALAGASGYGSTAVPMGANVNTGQLNIDLSIGNHSFGRVVSDSIDRLQKQSGRSTVKL